jgi:hypothetical protein
LSIAIRRRTRGARRIAAALAESAQTVQTPPP